MKFAHWRYLIIAALLTIFFNIIFLNNESVFGLRNLIAFLFLSFVPGYLILKIFKIDVRVDWHDITYVVGLSTAYLIIVGLGANYLIPLVQKVKPLERMPLLAATDVTLGILFIANIIGIFRTKHFNVKIHNDFHFSWWNLAFYIIPILFPVFALAGVAILNNGGANMFLMIYLLVIPVYFGALFLLSKRVDENIFPYSLYMISLALLLHSGMRGWNVSGTDVLREFHIFHLTYTNAAWSPDLIKHTYNACLSINILPTFMARFIDTDLQYMFKFFMQFSFAFTPVVVYYFTQRFTTKVIAFLSAFFFMSFPIFIFSMTMHVRQEFAFLFFCLILMVLFDTNFDYHKKNLIAMVFGFCMIVSHYSTTYLALLFFALWYASYFFFHWTFKIPALKKKIYGSAHTTETHFSKSNLSIVFIIFLFVTAFIWYTQVVHIEGDVVNFGIKVRMNLTKIFRNDLLPDQNSLANQFNIFYKQVDKTEALNRYFTNNNKRPPREIDLHFYPPSSYSGYYPKLVDAKLLPQKAPDFVYPLYTLYSELIKKIQKFLIIIGVFLLIYHQWKDKQTDSDFLLINMATLFIILLFIVVPFFSLDYDLLRATQQFLIILAFTSLYAIDKLLSYVKLSWLTGPLVGVILASYFVINTFSINQIIGKIDPPYSLNNYGNGYERSVVFDTEVTSSQWLEKNAKLSLITQADQDSQSRIFMSTITNFTILPNILPGAMYKAGYVYLNDLNVKQGVTNANYNGTPLRFTIPQLFLDDNKNLIYSNGNTQIYR
jgi:uncharacterized membrane protein